MSRRPHHRSHPRPTPPVASDAPQHTLDTPGLIDRIAQGDLDPILPLIAPVIQQRLWLLHEANRLAALARFTVGDRVRINHTVKPAYLHGATGTVHQRVNDRMVVLLDQPVGRFRDGHIQCPPDALELELNGRE